MSFRWQPGESGNPSGSNKVKRMGAVLRRLMAEPAGDDPSRTVAERFWQEVIRVAVERGDAVLIREILLRHDGPVMPPDPPVEDMSLKSDEELQRIVRGNRG
jgi:hypothetical protein